MAYRRVGGLGVLLVTAAVLQLVACGPGTHRRDHFDDAWQRQVDAIRVDGDLDRAEARWREEIARERTGDDRLLTDDPPGEPASYGTVASAGESAPDGDAQDEAPAPEGFWGSVQAGASSAGKATFAAMTVLVTVGMAVAPYLLML